MYLAAHQRSFPLITHTWVFGLLMTSRGALSNRARLLSVMSNNNYGAAVLGWCSPSINTSVMGLVPWVMRHPTHFLTLSLSLSLSLSRRRSRGL
jgi:hypothetical protein